jgi:hypothetical protein
MRPLGRSYRALHAATPARWFKLARHRFVRLGRAASSCPGAFSSSIHIGAWGHGAVTSVLYTLPRLQDGFNWHGVLQATTASCFEPRVSRALGLYGGRWVFGVYVWLGGTLRASDRGRSALPTCIRKPQTPKPSCLPACCLLPVIILDWAASIHLCSQVRQSALYKLVVKAKPSPAPRAAHPAAPCLYHLRAGRRVARARR